MKLIHSTLLLVCLFFSCSKDDSSSNRTILSNLGILGEWEIYTQGIDNMTSTQVFCCVFLSFTDDTNISDLKGHYSYHDDVITTGVFTVNPIENSIMITTENNNAHSLFYSLETNILKVWYFENDIRYWSAYQKIDN